MSHARKIAVIGLGYVGLPVAAAFARPGTRWSDSISITERDQGTEAGRDRTREVEVSDLKLASLSFHRRQSGVCGAPIFSS